MPLCPTHARADFAYYKMCLPMNDRVGMLLHTSATGKRQTWSDLFVNAYGHLDEDGVYADVMRLPCWSSTAHAYPGVDRRCPFAVVALVEGVIVACCHIGVNKPLRLYVVLRHVKVCQHLLKPLHARYGTHRCCWPGRTCSAYAG